MQVNIEIKQINSKQEELNPYQAKDFQSIPGGTSSSSRSGQRKLRQTNHMAMAQVKLSGPAQERQILECECQWRISVINEYFASMNAYQSSGRRNAIQDAITKYLTSKGTPVAMELLRDYERRGWANV